MISAKQIKLILGPLLAGVIYFGFDLMPSNPLVTKMAAVAVWMAVWWLTEAVHLAVTALLPVVLLPVLGIADSKTTAFQYMDPIIFLFIGGFIIAFAIERWNLHQRIALKILMLVGTSPSRILFGVMLTSFLISMWISNTATVMMLLSAVLAVIVQIEQHFKEEHHSHKMASALLIGLAYSATIGGMSTLVGTPTNMIFLREYNEKFSGNHDMNFFVWFKICFPIALAFLFIAFFVLKKMFIKKDVILAIDKSYFSDAYKRLGKMSFEEKMVSTIFVLTAVLWFTRADIDFGVFLFKGWSNVFPNKEFLQDSTIAVFMAILLFLIPSQTEKGRALMTWAEVTKLPYDIILLFGGGFALAKGFELSGLSTWLATQLKFTPDTNIYVLIFLMCVLVCIISEFASNVACIQLMLPVLIAIQHSMNIHPLLLMVPATLAASLGFMLPVATGANTIVFGSKRVRVNDMLKSGFLLDIIGILLITFSIYFMKQMF
ncbi:MAG: SLC13/DASS family transporter [Bacteroidetes bacterium]|nr:SLC13/DASS family transporter [Bacteroidota bacterium]